MEPTECENCDGTGCPCMKWRDWYSMELGCECGCHVCGLGIEPKAPLAHCAYGDEGERVEATPPLHGCFGYPCGICGRERDPASSGAWVYKDASRGWCIAWWLRV